MIGEVLDSIHNYFENAYETGDYVFENGSVAVKGTYYKDGYVRIIGTVQNDGVYKVNNFADGVLTIEELKAEIATCYIVRLAIPSAFLSLYNKIVTFQTNADKHKGIISESIQGYYSVSFGNNDFETEFSSELSVYKKIPFGKLDFIDFVPEF